MAIGIRVKGNGNNFPDAKVFTDGDGIDVEGDDNSFARSQVFSSKDDLARLVAMVKLPVNTPPEYLREVIEAVRLNPLIDEKMDFRLKAWLFDNGFNLAFWVQTIQSLIPIIVSSSWSIG